MASSINEVRNETQFTALTTLTFAEFEILNSLFSDTYQKKYGVSIEEAQENMQTEFVFSDTKSLLFYVLFHMKNDMIGEAYAFVFGTHPSSIHYNFKKGVQILHDTLAENGLMPARHFETMDEFIEYFKKEEKLILDATEFKIQRPADPEKQKEMYSGKKKIHSQKSLVICNDTRKILYLSPLFSGKTHDYAIFKEVFPFEKGCFQDQKVFVDLGFIGIRKDYEIENLLIPHKKKRVKKGESNALTQAQKDENKAIGSQRVVVEHSIGELKRCRILQQTLRIRKKNLLEQLVGIAASLVNFRKRN